MKIINQPARLYFIDNLRVAVIILVVAHHAGQSYGPTGGQWPLFEPVRSPLLGPFFSVNATFVMGLFFLISGYFLPRSYDRKGAGTFLKDRLLRLGIPLLIFALPLLGPTMYLMEYVPQGGALSFWQFFIRIYLGKWQVEFAHMWFVAHLIVYAVGYTLWCQLARRGKPTARRETPVPGHRAILGYTLTLAVVTAVVRIWYPINSWERVLRLVPAEFAHLPQYLSLFVIGIVAYRRDWLRRLPTTTGMTWLGIGLAAALARYAYSLGGHQLLPSILEDGGLDWRSLVWSIWEALICVGLCVGLLVLFRERLNGQGKLLPVLSAAVYTVYIIHVPVIVGLQFGMVPVALPPFVKFLLVTLIGVPLCFGISYLIKKLPLARRIL
ncbi:MAG: acyltransferase family protein [Acidobacteriota bacterium]